jgi:ribonuclease T2
MPELEAYWPSLYCTSSKRCFGGKGPIWAHEWEKHGTCSYPVIQDEYDYFATTLNLYTKYNVTRILKNAGIDAQNGEKYLLGDVVSAIKNDFGATPLLVCKHGSVEELRICFYKDFKPRDCVNGLSSNVMGDITKSSSSCPRYISLPTYEPLVVDDMSGEIVTSEKTDVYRFQASA